MFYFWGRLLVVTVIIKGVQNGIALSYTPFLAQQKIHAPMKLSPSEKTIKEENKAPKVSDDYTNFSVDYEVQVTDADIESLKKDYPSAQNIKKISAIDKNNTEDKLGFRRIVIAKNVKAKWINENGDKGNFFILQAENPENPNSIVILVFQDK